jgi:SAM-dependent methyltransferase
MRPAAADDISMNPASPPSDTADVRSRVIAAYPGPYLRAYAALKMRTTPYPDLSASLPRHGDILELGCGYGFLANYLWFDAPDRRVVGVDLDAAKIRRAQATVGDRQGIAFVRRDVRDYPMSRIDGCVMVDFLHHIPYRAQEELLDLVAAKLPPGGRLAIRETATEPRLKYFVNYCSDLLLYPFAEKCRFRSTADMTALLESRGFAVKSFPDHEGSPFACVRYECVKG